MHALERLTSDVIEQIRADIAAAEGQEVLFVGACDSTGSVVSAEAVARGNVSAVPAPFPHMERGQVVIHNHPSGRLVPSDADLSIAAELSSRGVGSLLVDNNVERVYPIVEPVPPRERIDLPIESLADVLRPGGRAEQLLEGFESRSEQVGMLELVARGFNEDRHVVCEAGTGVGKSFAYLVPAIRWAEKNDERVVISTATITLQHQLIEKDIPTVQRILGTDVSVVLVKGRGNYLCETRLGEAIQEQTELFDTTDDLLSAVREWASTTTSGQRSDLPFYADDELWGQVNADGDNCSPLRCRNSDCFLVRARREAAGARILVVNHHLLFSDLNLRVLGFGYDSTAVLPPFARIVIDEAHTVERIATGYFSEEYLRFGLLKLLRRLVRSRGQRSAGLLFRIRDESGDDALLSEALDLLAGLEEIATALDEAARPVFQDRDAVRLMDLPRDVREGAVLSPTRKLHASITALVDRIVRALERIEDDESSVLIDGRGIVRRLEALGSVCLKVTDFSDSADETVFYIERVRGRRGDSCVRLVCAPLDIARMMDEAVYTPLSTVVCTSATLTIKRSFEYWKGRVGLSVGTRAPLEEVFDSPFDYARRVLLALPTDAPSPGERNYVPFVSGFVKDLLLLTEGRGLVLFTSHAMLREVFDAVEPELRSAGIACLRHGSDDRSRLLGRFREDTASVLFGTDTFWEGVDMPGPSLEVVIVCRLPFGVPTHPVAISRAEAIQRDGGNSFMELSIPEAVVRFKQGFGRLMRKTSDRGVVAVTDPRIFLKSYGALFRGSLPETSVSRKSTKDILEDVERFLY